MSPKPLIENPPIRRIIVNLNPGDGGEMVQLFGDSHFGTITADDGVDPRHRIPGQHFAADEWSGELFLGNDTSVWHEKLGLKGEPMWVADPDSNVFTIVPLSDARI